VLRVPKRKLKIENGKKEHRLKPMPRERKASGEKREEKGFGGEADEVEIFALLGLELPVENKPGHAEDAVQGQSTERAAATGRRGDSGTMRQGGFTQ